MNMFVCETYAWALQIARVNPGASITRHGESAWAVSSSHSLEIPTTHSAISQSNATETTPVLIGAKNDYSDLDDRGSPFNADYLSLEYQFILQRTENEEIKSCISKLKSELQNALQKTRDLENESKNTEFEVARQKAEQLKLNSLHILHAENKIQSTERKLIRATSELEFIKHDPEYQSIKQGIERRWGSHASEIKELNDDFVYDEDHSNISEDNWDPTAIK